MSESASTGLAILVITGAQRYAGRMGGETSGEIDPERLAEWLGEEEPPQLIDVREPYEREAGYIEDSRHIELVALTDAAATVARERPVVFYCRVGGRSTMAMQAFRASGYEAYSLQGGLVRWADEGRPISPQGGTVANH